MRKLIVTVIMMTGFSLPAMAQNLRIGGTGVSLELARVIAADLSHQQPAIQLWMPESLGSGGGIKALAAGRLDVALSTRALKDGEVAGGKSFEMCRTPWVFYSHATRPDVALAQSDLPSLFTATLPPFVRGEVRALLRPVTESGFQYLETTFPPVKSAIEQARQNRAAVEAITDQDAMREVEQAPSLVGFGALAPILAEHRKLHVVSLDGVDPTRLSQDYPHWSGLFLLVGETSSPQGRAFVDYALSGQADALMRANGCLPVAR